MKNSEKTQITVKTTIQAPIEKVWERWTNPAHLVFWNSASDDWHSPRAENDLRVNGKFNTRMEAKDGSAGFDFEGTYTKVEPLSRIDYQLTDGRQVKISFQKQDGYTQLTETFDAENLHPIEMQQAGWQAILDRFKSYSEQLQQDSRLHFEILIDAKVDKVYQTMLSSKHYTEWTSAFDPTSHFQGSWTKGEEIRFIGTDHNGNEGGIICTIQENIPNQLVNIQYQALIQKGQAISTGPEAEKWIGRTETYTFKSQKDKTLLLVDTDSTKEFNDFFQTTWPQALKKLKAICEQK